MVETKHTNSLLPPNSFPVHCENRGGGGGQFWAQQIANKLKVITKATKN